MSMRVMALLILWIRFTWN
uniref:Uncharacterized protein n=1 Tax=Rhizophora mucronata TaxID=61149 RepID=A0A2P2N943_RHIMU